MADLNKLRYTHRDYESIKNDLIDAIPSLTQEWTSREDSDPGIVLIKLMSMFGDTLSYNVDKIALELYLSTVTQRKNCAKILSLLGYKMHWYRSGKIAAQFKLREEQDEQGNPVHIVLKPFQTTFSAGDIVYTVVPQGVGTGDIDISSSTSWTRVLLVQGVSNTLRFDYTNLVNNRFYFPDTNVDESNIWLTYGESRVCNLIDNLYLATDDQNVSFEFNIDEYDRPYIELVNYWEDILGTTARSDKFTLTYMVSAGADGNVTKNSLTKVLGLAEGKSSYLEISHLGNNNYTITDEDSEYFDEDNTPGQSPQTVAEARADAANYVFTHDTLVTSDDFQKAAKRVEGITGAKIVDNEIINAEWGDPDQAKQNLPLRGHDFEDEENRELKGYSAILYSVYDDFTPNQYSTLNTTDPYYVKDYDTYSKKLHDSLGAYPYKPPMLALNLIDEEYKESKILNVKIIHGTTLVFPFKVAGTLHLVEPMSPAETLLVVTTVNGALTKYYYPSNHDYGDKPKFMDIVDIIQNADSNIKYFDAIGNIVEYSKTCDLDKFDPTSFTMYNGLSDNFNLDLKFRRFKIKNLSRSTVELTNFKNAGGTPDKITGQTTLTITVDNISQLDALCKDMSSSIVYVRS